MHIVPMIEEYLKGEKFGAERAFVSDDDLVFFTIPLLGLFCFTKSGYVALNILTLIFFAIVLLIYMKMKGLKLYMIFRRMLWPLAFFAGSFVAGEAVGWLAACINGEKFDFIVSKEQEGVRIDKLISEEEASLSRTFIQKLIEEGNVLVNGKECTFIKTDYCSGAFTSDTVLVYEIPIEAHMGDYMTVQISAADSRYSFKVYYAEIYVQAHD